MYTLPEYRKKGTGSILLDKSVDEAKKRRIKKIRLHATDIGRSLYEKKGFVSKNIEMVLLSE